LISEKDKPPIEQITPTLLKSVGVVLQKDKDGIKFIFKDKKVLDDLAQLGFSIDILRVAGGEMPLPILAEHLDNQAALEAYWAARAEKARYEFMKTQDIFNYWYESKYARCFRELQERGVPKPIQKEVEARISREYGKVLKIKKEELRLAEYNFRILHNACFASMVTKGKMMQTLRNVIQGGNIKVPLIETEDHSNIDVKRIRVEG
jgi:hypothetical protein